MIIFKRKSPKVLYITGYPRSGEGDGNILTFEYIKEIGFDAIDINVDYCKEKPEIILERIKRVVRDNKIELVFGLSTGGLFAACLKGVNKILINPCFNIGTILLFQPQIPLSISLELRELKKRIIKDNNTYGFFGTQDDVAHSEEDFIKLFGSDKCFEITSRHVPRSFEWNEYIIPTLRRLTRMDLKKIKKIEHNKPAEKKDYAFIDGIRLPGVSKYFPLSTVLKLRLEWLKKKGVLFKDIKILKGK